MDDLDSEVIAYAKLKAEFEQQKMLLEKQSKLSKQLQMALDVVNRNLLKEKEQNKLLENELDQAKSTSKLQSIALELKNAKAEISHLKHIEQTYENKMEQLNDHLIALEVQLETTQHKNECLQEEVVVTQKKGEMLQHKHAALEEAILSSDEEAAKLAQINEQLQAELTEMQSANKMLTDQYNDILTQNVNVQHQLEDEKATLTSKLQSISKERDLFEQQYKHILEKSTEGQLGLEEQIAELTSNLQYVLEERNLFEDETKSQLMKMDEHETKIELLEMQAQYNATKMGEQTAKIEQLKKELKEVQVTQELANTLVNVNAFEEDDHMLEGSGEEINGNPSTSELSLEKEALTYIEELINGNVSFLDEIAKIQQYSTELASESESNLLLNRALELVKAEAFKVEDYYVLEIDG